MANQFADIIVFMPKHDLKYIIVYFDLFLFIFLLFSALFVTLSFMHIEKLTKWLAFQDICTWYFLHKCVLISVCIIFMTFHAFGYMIGQFNYLNNLPISFKIPSRLSRVEIQLGVFPFANWLATPQANWLYLRN